MSDTIVTFTLEQLEKHNKEFMDKARTEERERIVNLLKEKAWVEEDKAYLKFDTVLVPLQRLLDEIVRGGENE